MSKRIFVRSSGTDDMWCFCGGPDLHQVMQAISHVIESDVEQLLSGVDTDCEIEIQCRDMTDAEVAAIPEV